ncbi:uncharacterized protein A4U43_C05F2810 [Asparagus officinalis]|uniref:Mediator of RNA polymerase II transcription subunit 7 n=1 Tax=Asparagus officinalis TaxID=4686 RepID=A0A5P1ESL1_ASPOF|nr:uncharacterized protein A4U43_C05F2810 [Asparagus officinalis]
MATATTSSSYPPPPPYYRLYKDYLQDPSSAPDPPPPVDGAYPLFGATYTTDVVLPSLEDQGVRQLYPKGPTIDFKKELRALNRELQLHILELADVLVERPSQYARRVEEISLIFKNLHHLLNSLRPHQARATLIHILESQIQRRKEAVEDIKRRREEAQKLLKESLQTLDGNHGDLKRFFLSAFYHMGESHLVYNMLSLLWKGIQLETSMGSLEFATMIASLLGLSQGITLLMAKGLLLFFDYDTPYYRQYSVGFSGVLFAMKVVLNAQADDYTYVHGMIVPSRHAAWAELILIQLFVPGVSFLGHLGGILAGLVYLRLRGSHTGPDPVAALIRNVGGIIGRPLRFIRSLFWPQRQRISGRGTVGGSQGAWDASSVWRCEVCTFDNSGLLDVCEMCSTERGGPAFSPVRTLNSSGDLSVDEVRRRRLERFDR